MKHLLQVQLQIFEDRGQTNIHTMGYALLRTGRNLIAHSLKMLSHQPKPLSMNISHTKISVLLIGASQV